MSVEKSPVAIQFKEIFGEFPETIVRAPGRVNIIGEHIDYNGGPVLPMAIDREVIVAGRKLPDNRLRFISGGYSNLWQGTLPVRKSENPTWVNYPLGVIAEFEKQGIAISGFEAFFYSDVPTGSGLSSSAALEVVTAHLLMELFDVTFSPMETALLCQRAENDFVGVNCGLMDQAASACAEETHLLLLDCGKKSYEQVPFPSDRLAVVIAHSGVKRGLSSSAYNQRRSECEGALDTIRELIETPFSNLCSVPVAVFQEVVNCLPEVQRRRARHVIGETDRVLKTGSLLSQGAFAEVGALLNESHTSLRDDYEVSCEELDQLTRICREFDGVFGSRLTGAGFGGCTVSLVKPEQAEALIYHLEKMYYKPKQINPLAFASKPAAGAGLLKLNSNGTAQTEKSN